MNTEFGIVRVSSVVLKVAVADPLANTTEILRVLNGETGFDVGSSDIVVFPELCISGYSCGELFHQKRLLDECITQLKRLATSVSNKQQLLLVGLPIRCGNALYNCVAALNDGRVIGIVPKQYLPNYKEFYEARWFATGQDKIPETISIYDEDVPFGSKLLFQADLPAGCEDVVVSAEICEAIWLPVPPSSLATMAGANIICNPSASNETVGKASYRRNLVIGQSGRCICAYAYTSSGPTESTNDVVFGGHAMIAQTGHMLAESTRVGDFGQTNRNSYVVAADIDVEKLNTERRSTNTFEDVWRSTESSAYRRIPFDLKSETVPLLKPVNAMPFVPSQTESLEQTCSEVFGIQTAALAKRLDCLGDNPKLSIGISGGLDSTLALLVAVKTCDLVGLPRSVIHAVTMPGFGTTKRTHTNAWDLMRYLNVSTSEIDIREVCLEEFKILAQCDNYKPFGEINLSAHTSLAEFEDAIAALSNAQRSDLVFENVQARCRTELLMNLGFVLGTGDMSEMWLGWCTYNADQQSMYNVNCSIPKTLVKFLVQYVAKHEFEGDIRQTLLSISETEISPELLPLDKDGALAQSTEDTVGPYELHDFYMFNIIRYGFDPSKILFLAQQAHGWSRDYSEADHRKWLKENIRRAFTQQYKRDNVPNGPKVGSISLSPRGDWRMPSDASYDAWVNEL